MRYNNTQQQLKLTLLMEGNRVAAGICLRSEGPKKDAQNLQAPVKLGENCNKWCKTFMSFPLRWLRGGGGALLRDLVMGVPSPPPRFGGPPLTPCSDAEGLRKRLQVGVRPRRQPLWRRSPLSLLTIKHRSVSLEFSVPHRAATCSGGEGRRDHPCGCVWTVGLFQQARSLGHSKKRERVAESHRSLPCKNLPAIFDNLQTNTIFNPTAARSSHSVLLLTITQSCPGESSGGERKPNDRPSSGRVCPFMARGLRLKRGPLVQAGGAAKPRGSPESCCFLCPQLLLKMQLGSGSLHGSKRALLQRQMPREAESLVESVYKGAFPSCSCCWWDEEPAAALPSSQRPSPRLSLRALPSGGHF